MPHSYSTNLVHCVFSTKERANLIPNAIQDRLYAYIHGIARNIGIQILAVGGTSNHLHILLALPPRMALSDVLRDVKANSSRWMTENHPPFAWQEGFAAFSVSPSQAHVVKTYIRNQKEHHRKRDFEDEFLSLLRKSGIDCDPQHLFG